MQKLFNLDKRYESFRWFFTSNNVLVIGGKSDEQNEIALREFLKKNYVVMHTSEPGSSFMIIQSDKPDKKDLEETAIFCACFSKQWKSGNKKIKVDVFKGEQIYKTPKMKTGTFGLKNGKTTVEVKPELVLVIQRGILRAIPKSSNEEKLAEIKQGQLTKEQAADKIFKKIKEKYHLPVSRDEIMQAIPSDKLDVK
jgi:hypothetical protein